jgi:hypothetical protein
MIKGSDDPPCGGGLGRRVALAPDFRGLESRRRAGEPIGMQTFVRPPSLALPRTRVRRRLRAGP